MLSSLEGIRDKKLKKLKMAERAIERLSAFFEGLDEAE